MSSDMGSVPDTKTKIRPIDEKRTKMSIIFFQMFRRLTDITLTEGKVKEPCRPPGSRCGCLFYS